jgi:thymidylate synthase
MQTIKRTYKPLHKANQLILGTGTVVVVTGWTPIKTIQKRLSESDYAVIGSLYSFGGIDILVRNLLANPQITGLLLIKATKQDRISGSIDNLIEFLKTGKGAKLDILAEDINNLLKISYCVTESIDAENLKDRVVFLESKPVLALSPKLYELKIDKPSVYPGHLAGHRIEGKTIAETWVRIIHRIKTTGTIRPTGYDGQWQELINLTAVVTDEPEEFYFPEPNYLPCNREFVGEYIPQMLKNAPYKEGVKYTYGQRLRSWFGRDQIQEVITKLINEPDAASAVMSLWDSGNGQHQGKHPDWLDNDSDHQHGGSPCLNHIWVRIVENRVILVATLRSNDMFNAWAANAFQLRALQMHIRYEIQKQSGTKYELGQFVTNSLSAHIYDNSWGYADKLIEEQYSKLCKPTYDDPSGNYLIDLHQSVVRVQRTDSKGVVIATYEGREPLALVRKLVKDAPAMQPAHSAYLALEIQRACQFLSIGQEFVQDA